MVKKNNLDSYTNLVLVLQVKTSITFFSSNSTLFLKIFPLA